MMKNSLFLTLVLGLAPFVVVGADSPTDTTSSTDTTAAAPSPGPDSDGTVSSAPAEGPLSRWFELDAMNFSIRYRNSFDTDGVHIFDDAQQRSLLAGKFKLDKDGKYFIGFRASSGHYFNWSYANFAGTDYKDVVLNTAVTSMSLAREEVLLGAYYADPNGAAIVNHLDSRGWSFYIRDLYLSATPVKQLTLEFGAIPIEHGVGTEITTFDDDGYISGERLRVHDARHLYFDEIDFTAAYLGDINVPNFFDRYDRLTQNNYRQFMVQKRFKNRFRASMDYTWIGGTHTWREAVLSNIKETHALDSVRVELYQRTNGLQLPGYFATSGYGWAFTAGKRFHKRFSLEGGFASVDQDYGVYSLSSTYTAAGFGLNGDSFQVGNRYFARANVKLANYASLFGFYTHEINPHPDPLHFSWTTQNLNFGMQVDFKPLVKAAHWL